MHFTGPRAWGAARPPPGPRHVLDAHLEADGRAALRQVLEAEERGVALDHRDHAGGRQHREADRAADVGDEQILDDELVGPGDSGLERHDPIISSPSGPAANLAISAFPR